MENIFCEIEEEFESDLGRPTLLPDECHDDSSTVVATPNNVSPSPGGACVKNLNSSKLNFNDFVKTSVSSRVTQSLKRNMPSLNIVRTKRNAADVITGEGCLDVTENPKKRKHGAVSLSNDMNHHHRTIMDVYSNVQCL